MKLEDVRSIAKSRGIHPAKLSKLKLIRTLQIGEGNFDCFATTASGECDRWDCMWRADCFEAAKKGESS
ncbi:MAG: SAP domain-containing protein [Gallionellaceae bacterium]|nr:SAP domain-containing protein [Gallionellaceae bacterium]